MPVDSFRVLLIDQEAGQTQARFTELTPAELPPGEVLIRIAYSSLNYKDGLAVTGRGKVIRKFPMVPGIDFVGTVVDSTSAEFQPGDWVVLTGSGAGEQHWGGYAELARVQADWLVPLPEGLTPQQASGLGTAGVTAMLCVMTLQAHGCHPGSGEVVVTGASGGVGSMAVLILARLGYRVVAVTGRAFLTDYLQSLGAASVVDRAELAGPPAKPLGSQRWAGAVDGVGGHMLATLLSMMKDGGSVTAYGLTGGHELHTTVYPFILRGVNLLGINTAALSKEQRLEIWRRLVHEVPLELLERIIQVEPLSDIFNLSDQILGGQIKGRVVIDVHR